MMDTVMVKNPKSGGFGLELEEHEVKTRIAKR